MIQKFSDGSAVFRCINGGRKDEYRGLVDRFVEWTGDNHLLLKVEMTNEMVIDFRKKGTQPRLLHRQTDRQIT